MCRNITTLRGLEPAATDEEIEAAARQYVRKVSGVQKTSERTEAAFEKAVRRITLATEELLAQLARRATPTLPPLRRIAARLRSSPRGPRRSGSIVAVRADALLLDDVSLTRRPRTTRPRPSTACPCCRCGRPAP